MNVTGRYITINYIMTIDTLAKKLRNNTNIIALILAFKNSKQKKIGRKEFCYIKITIS